MVDILSTSRRARSNVRRGGALAVSLVSLSLLVAGCGSSGGGGATTTGGTSTAPTTANVTSTAPTTAAPTGGTSSAPSTATTPSGSSTAGGNAALAAITAQNVSLPSGTPGKGKPAVTLGDKNFAEEYLLGDLYLDALQAKGFTVKLKANIGSSADIDAAFKSGIIDLYPEYLGEIVTTVANEKPPKTAVATYNAAKKFEQANRDATLLKQTPFQDVDVLFVKPSFAKKYNLTTIADLSKVGPKGKGVTYVAPTAYRSRFSGLVGLNQAYGLTAIKFAGTPVGAQYKAFDQGVGNVGDAFSTDAPLSLGIKAGKYATLTDPKGIFGFQYVAPVVKKSVLSAEGPAFTQTLNWVSSLLTLKAMRQLDIAVQANHHPAAAVAKAFLAANGLK